MNPFVAVSIVALIAIAIALLALVLVVHWGRASKRRPPVVIERHCSRIQIAQPIPEADRKAALSN